MPPRKSKPQSPMQPPSTRSSSSSKRESAGEIGNTNASFEPTEESNEMLRYVIFKFEEVFDKFKTEVLTEIKKRDERIAELENEVTTLNRDMKALQERTDDLESSNRQSDFVMSGNATSINGSDNPVASVCIILKNKLNYVLSPDNILSASRIGKKPDNQAPDGRRILVRMRTNQVKTDVILACKTARPSNLYINDNLTPARAQIMYALKQAKRKKPEILSACGSINGNVFAWTKPTSPTGRSNKFYLNTWKKLEVFCERSLNLQADELIKSTSSG